MVDKKILNYDEKMLSFWLRHYAGCSFPEYFGAKKGHLGFELQQTPEEYTQLLLWLKNQNFENYLELGVGRGGSFLLNVLFQPSLENAICVDNSEYWKDEQREDIYHKVDWLNENTNAIVGFCSMSTDEYFSKVAGVDKFDCIFIDADHSYDGVKKDFDNALKHIKDGGYIIFHDIASVQCPGVQKIWKDNAVIGNYLDGPDGDVVCTGHQEFIHGANCGIGIMSVKVYENTKFDEAVNYLFETENIFSRGVFELLKNSEKKSPVLSDKVLKPMVDNLPSIRKGLVIVETRKGVGLVDTINNHLKYLGDDWGVHVFCSEENRHELMEQKMDAWDRFQYSIVKYHMDTYKYNRLLTSPMFWDELPYDKVFITQTDARMLRKGIEEFMPYDYVGAPWTFCEHGGNGGFSLRTVSVMKEVIDKVQHNNENEDIYFCNAMKNHNIGKLAPRDVNSKFSMETILNYGTLGVHAIDRYFDKETCEKIMNQYE